jgi:transposase
VVSNTTHTLFSYSPKRGEEGIKASQVLTEFSGNLVHDFWKSYEMLDCTHSRCNTHLLRELTACVEDGHPWAEPIITILLAMKHKLPIK